MILTAHFQIYQQEYLKILYRPRLIQQLYLRPSLPKKCPYSELFWSASSHIWTEYGEIRSISSYSVRMRENVDQNNSKYGHFLRSAFLPHRGRNSSSQSQKLLLTIPMIPLLRPTALMFQMIKKIKHLTFLIILRITT